MVKNNICKRCGKKLTNSKSIELGYGNFCYKIKKLEENDKSDIQDLNNEVKILRDQIESIAKYIRLGEIMKEDQVNSEEDNNQNQELLDRVRKLELDDNFMKHQLKHKTFVNGKSKDAELDWVLKPEVKEVIAKFEIEFTVVIKELKLILKGDDFDYHTILKPIEPRNEPEIIENIQFAKIEG